MALAKSSATMHVFQASFWNSFGAAKTKRMICDRRAQHFVSSGKEKQK
jgi:hypothetical protein